MAFWELFKSKKKVKPQQIATTKSKSVPPKAVTAVSKPAPKEITITTKVEEQPIPVKDKPAVPPRKPRPKAVINRNHESEFVRIFKKLTIYHSPWMVWQDFITMFACSISNAVDKSHYDKREKLYMDTIKKYNKSDQQLFPDLVAELVMALEEKQEQDFLGHLYMTLELYNSHKAQMFTPYHVCQLMAAVSIEDIVKTVKEQGYITINAPCCGAGATLIAAIHEAKTQLDKESLNFQNHVLIAAQDIDSTVALMCYIQISLLGMAGYVKIGNTLTEPMVEGDSLENYWFTPIYFSDVWGMRRIVKNMDNLFK